MNRLLATSQVSPPATIKLLFLLIFLVHMQLCQTSMSLLMLLLLLVLLASLPLQQGLFFKTKLRYHL